ncbi:MAG: hypothetical protein J5777_06725 [Clostridiales bacterium]|nr:hypothetical protein [Clostridiales bacterium]
MEDRKTIFEYISQLFTTYGIIVLIFIVINCFIGNEARSVSTLFSLGSAGLSSATLAELLLLAFIITVAQNVFLSDILIKNMALIVRNILFFMTVMIAIAVFVILFGWFPINEAGAWIGFLVSFAVCTAVSAFFMRLEERAENKKMQEALNKLKK